MRKYVLILALAMPLSAVAQYTIEDLGTLGGNWSGAMKVSSSRHVIGLSSIPSGPNHAFLWRDGGMIDLGVLGGVFVSSQANGVNVFDHVVGFSSNASGEFRHAFLWLNGEMTDLGTFGGSNSMAISINDLDQVVGGADTSAGVRRAFIWEGGTMTDLGTLPGGDRAGANDINSLSQVVGSSSVGGGASRPFLWDSGAMTDLGSLGGDRGTAYAVNDSAQAVGRSEISPSGARHAFLWQNGIMTDLGTLGGDSLAYDINASGDVVGWSDGRAFLWRSGAMTDLNDLLPPGSGWYLANATGINDAGQIVGFGGHDGESRAFLMTPVPEPGTFVALSIAILALLGRRRK